MNKSTAWFLGIIGVLLFLGVGAMLFFYVLFMSPSDEEEVSYGSGGKVAVVELQGTIVSSEDVVRQLKKFGDDNSVKAILLRVDSPGGGVAASQEMYEEVKKVRAHKPVIASMGSVAASGGYYVSCGATRVVANRGTLTGSIGVISEFFRFDPMLDKVGVNVNTIKSGKLKDAGSPYRKMTDVDKKYFQDLMDDVHRQFISVVEHERKLGHDEVVELADGRAFTGEQALSLRLVDTIGTYEDAVGIAAKLAGIKGKPTIVKERKHKLTFFDVLFGQSKISDVLNLKDELLNQPILQYKMVP
ncbi:MAG: signal peptide peptidase SppA [Bacteroidota bacterium]|jgi:protease-4